MRTLDQTMEEPRYLGDVYYKDSITIATKGLEFELVRIMTVFTAIDFSTNRFEGHIPSIMGDLIALRVLNLSHNRLQGHIPNSLENLSVVESVDISFNQLSGAIPQQLASLTYLEFLNLSNNHLQGCIPQGPQFQTFENNSYERNNSLRGFPLSKGCEKDRVSETNYILSVVVAWSPYAVPDLDDWVRKLAATSSYDERKWRNLSKGKWDAKNHGIRDVFKMRPALPGKKTASLIPKLCKDSKK
uniref:Receptor-like protein 12 n=1 Tax=Nicotiana sylvestris TaxID=4096 RepID=A0A1U7X3W9_NICSY|nr:PREDICTED: receptor-like protein 12 [Nicotiana sylvestris]